VQSQIFIDYGEAWEEAWKDHVEHWTSPCLDGIEFGDCLESSRLVSFTMKQDRHNTQYHTWSDVHLTACQCNSSHPWESGGKVIFLTNSPTDDTNTPMEYLGFSYDDEGFDYPYLSMLDPRPCKIIQSHPESDTFDVVYFFQPFQVPHGYKNDTTRILVHYESLPSLDLHFFNKPLKGDLNDPSAFRHEIHIPDVSFPSLWKDFDQSSESKY
jgi:hypothetical protein